jgi:hypothetical protein
LSAGWGFGVSLVAWPLPARPDEYTSASQEIEALLERLPGRVAVYRTGSIAVPGISDLDRIAVVEGSVTVSSVWPRLSERARYLAMHTPFLADRATFERHRWFAYLEPLELCFGSAVQVDARPSSDHGELLMGAESLMACLLRLVKQISTGRLKIRQFLCELNNVKHGLGLAGLDQRDVPSAWRVAEDVAMLRASWFSSPRPERAEAVRDLAARAAPALLQALAILGEKCEPEQGPTRMRLRAPWSNVTLVARESSLNNVIDAPRMSFPFNRSARIAELRWRGARPEIPLHPGVLGLLAGSDRSQREFRTARDEIVRSYSRFLDVSGRGYSGIGLAMPFLAP